MKEHVEDLTRMLAEDYDKTIIAALAERMTRIANQDGSETYYLDGKALVTFYPAEILWEETPTGQKLTARRRHQVYK